MITSGITSHAAIAVPKYWRREGAICHEGRDAEAKQYKEIACVCMIRAQ
jgi:hypothetical protein